MLRRRHPSQPARHMPKRITNSHLAPTHQRTPTRLTNPRRPRHQPPSPINRRHQLIRHHNVHPCAHRHTLAHAARRLKCQHGPLKWERSNRACSRTPADAESNSERQTSNLGTVEPTNTNRTSAQHLALRVKVRQPANHLDCTKPLQTRCFYRRFVVATLHASDASNVRGKGGVPRMLVVQAVAAVTLGFSAGPRMAYSLWTPQ